MKRFHLSPLTRQAIIFCLLVALLWSNKPTPGTDGLVEAEYQDHASMEMLFLHDSIKPGQYFNIYLSTSPYPVVVRKALLVSMSRNRRPASVRFLITKLPWTHSFITKTISGRGFTIVVRIKPADWDKLEEAKRNGQEFCTYSVPIHSKAPAADQIK